MACCCSQWLRISPCRAHRPRAHLLSLARPRARLRVDGFFVPRSAGRVQTSLSVRACGAPSDLARFNALKASILAGRTDVEEPTNAVVKKEIIHAEITPGLAGRIDTFPSLFWRDVNSFVSLEVAPDGSVVETKQTVYKAMMSPSGSSGSCEVASIVERHNKKRNVLSSCGCKKRSRHVD